MKTRTAISFDLDDTLWPVKPALERAETALYEWLDAHYPRIGEQVGREGMHAIRDRLMEEDDDLCWDMTALRKAMLKRAAETAGYDPVLAEPAFQVFLHHRNHIDFYPEVPAVLQRLRGTYRLGAISNGNADIARVGLAPVFSFAISASQFGRAKPHPSTFRAAAAAAGVTLGELIHVGDDPHSDVAGARALGMHAVWVNRHGAPWPPEAGPRPTLEIRTLDELPALIQRLNADR